MDRRNIMDTKCADPTLQLDVDVMTIDFLVHDALQTVLKEARSGIEDTIEAASRLGLVDDALTIFNNHHPTPPDLPDLEFRLELLQFGTLFCRRHTHDQLSLASSRLRQLRFANQRRRTAWIRRHVPNNHPDAKLAETTVMKHLPAGHLLLLDLLPMFMSLCAVRADAAPSSYWLHLAAEFMLQAVLECGLDSGTYPELRSCMKTLEAEAFAWGCSGNTNLDDVTDINPVMFWDYDNDTTLAQWNEIKEEYRAEVKPPAGVNLLSHLVSVREDHKVQHFDKILVNFLAKLATSIQAPLLAELQGTKVTGLTEAETLRLKVRCGLSG